MTLVADTVGGRRRWARPLLWVAMPVLGPACQFCSVKTAEAMLGRPLDLGWFAQAIQTPWVPAWIGLEILSFLAWMVVLSQVDVSEAFPMTAVSYLLVVGLGWTVFHEPISALQLVGAGAILLGVRLLGSSPEVPR